MRKLLPVFAVASCFVAATALARPPVATKAAIHAALLEWTKALGSGQGEKPVVALYARDAILLATFAPQPLTTRSEIAAYFHKLTQKPHLKAVIHSETIDLFGNGAADTGLYTFSYQEGGKEVRVPARFTFVYRRIGRRWLIVSHHSSVVPQAH